MYELRYLRPGSLQEAVALLDEHPEARPLSGGMTLLPTLKQRLAAPSHLIDIARLPELQGVSWQQGHLRIGAATRHAEVASSSLVRRHLPALAALAGQIADPQVRNRGTMGGSVANNDPAADYPAAVLALGATVVTTRRRIHADEFFTGTFATALHTGELVTAIEFTPCDAAAYVKRRHPASGYAVVGVFIALRGQHVKLAVTGAGSCVFRWTAAEEALSASLSPGALDALRVAAADLPEDIHATAPYRSELIAVYARRAVESLLGGIAANCQS